jgi:phosphate transport system permease protein
MTIPANSRTRAPSGRQRAVAERTERTIRRRRIRSSIMVGLMYAAALIAILPLILIVIHLLRLGGGAINVDFFTKMPKPPGEPGGGMANAIVGTLIIIGLASAVGLPVGIGAGLYLAEKQATFLATTVRYLADVLNGLPSIVMGIFAWQLLVRPMNHFSALAGGVALGAMMVPMVTRTTEEMVRLVPTSLREAALALGYSRWRTAGETAPLLFTTLGNAFWSTSLKAPIAALPLQIFTYAITPYDNWIAQAWAGALVLVAIVFVISLAARVATRRRFGVATD